MSCSCATHRYRGEPGNFGEQKTVKARKEHECCACRRIIAKNECYESASGIWDGEFGRFKTCADCVSIRDAFFCDGYMFEFCEDLQYHLSDINGQVSSACLEGMTPAGRDMVIDMIDKLWFPHGH